jgi:hypothetical protein
MSPRNSPEKSIESKGRSRDAAFSEEVEPKRLNLGCGTLIVLFLLVSTAGKFLPYRDKSSVAPQTNQKAQSVTSRPKPELPSGGKKAVSSESAESTPKSGTSTKKPISDRAGEVLAGLVSSLQDLVGPEEKKVRNSPLSKPPVVKKPSLSQESAPPDSANVSKKPVLTDATTSSAEPRSPFRIHPPQPQLEPGGAGREETPAGPSPKAGAPSPLPGKSVVFNSPWDQSVAQVERYLKRRMHDASSMEILEWGKVSLTDRGGYQVRCTFRSKNVLGNYATQSKVFVMNKDGDVIDIRD